MLIECPSCKSRYRIRDEKLPGKGGNIRCPNCSHIFFVSRDNALDGEGAAPEEAAASTPVPGESQATDAPKAPEKWKLRNAIGLVFDFADLDQLQRWLGTRESFDGLEVSRDGGSSWSSVADHTELRDIRLTGKKTMLGMQSINTSQGGSAGDVSGLSSPNAAAPQLTADQMREQAQARIQSARASRGTQQMTPPPERREGSGVNARQSASRPAAATTGSSSTKSTGKKGFQRIRHEDDQQGSIWARIGVVVGIPVVVFGLLQAAGVIDVRRLFGGGGGMTSEELARYAGNDVPGELGREGEQDGRRAPEEAAPEVPPVAQLLQLAAVAYERNELSTAIGHLEQAVFLAPDDRETHCQLARLYTEAGRATDAAAQETLCNPPAEASGDAAGDGSGAAAPPAEQPPAPGEAPPSPAAP
jgi:predicted Zn finger-like uncharacterized protein